MAVVSTGFFDGVHTGHANVVKALVSAAGASREESLVITFWPHPRAVLQKDARDFRLLTTLEEKNELLKNLGVDRVEVLPFSRDFASMTASEYLENVVVKRYAASSLVLGYDNRIGSDMLSYGSLGPVAERIGLKLILVPEFRPGDAGASSGSPVSSTVIRRLLGEGEVEKAAFLLGRNYSMKGTVVTGNQFGRTIGFPTANIQLHEPLKLIPANGVYLSRVIFGGNQYYGMTNIGVRPTVSGESAPVTIETHIFNFNDDIYGLPLEISLIRRLREERRFGSVEELRLQLCADRAACEGMF